MESEENKKKSLSSNSLTSTFVSAKKSCIKFYSNKNSRKDGYNKLRESPSPPPTQKYHNKSTQTEPKIKAIQKDLIEL